MNDQIVTPDSDIVHFPLPDDNLVQTFTLDKCNVRGRVLRLGRVLNDIIAPLDYPDIVARLTAETAVLTVLLSSMLKYEGIFILQAQGDGAVNRLVADMTSAGDLRSCAGYDADKLALIAQDGTASLKDMLGTGYMAFTVDQGEHAERYQGIVSLAGETLQHCVHHYFNQSEQIKTAIKIALRRDEHGWRGGAIMLQHMPASAHIPQDVKPEDSTDDWNRACILLETCSDDELLDPRLHSNTVLYRLFHEEIVRVFDPQPIRKGCRCSIDKLQNVIKMLPPEDQDEIVVDGKITMTCEFCNKNFGFSPSGEFIE